MEKSKIVMGILAAATLGACQSSKVKISGRLVGADARQVYIEQLSAGGKAPLIDSVSLDDAGNYRFELKNVPSTPSLYTISYNGESVPVLIEGGDRLTINSAGSFARNYTVEGSAESELLREFYQAFVVGAQHLDEIASRFAEPNLSEERHRELMKEYTDEYFRIRREQLRFIVENKSLAAYLRQLENMGEDADDYASIWNYTHGETEPRFGLYVYPDFPFGVTGRVSNLELE